MVYDDFFDKDFRAPFCPYCMDGEIVEDKYLKNLFFCKVCLKTVKIPKNGEI